MTNEQDKCREALIAIGYADIAVRELCSGNRTWVMSIPAKPYSDCDLVIGRALHLSEQAITYLSKENAKLQKREAELVEALHICNKALELSSPLNEAFYASHVALANHQKKGE